MKNKGKLVNENQNCCLEMEINIQSLINELKSWNEIINILSEEWRQYKATEEVRNDRIQYAAKVKGNRALNCQSIIYYHSVNPNRIQSPYGCGISQF